jgi:DNA polymerase III epsilon subunit-like protein
MDAQLHAKLDEVVEKLRNELHQKAACWSKIRTPSELFDFEQRLQMTLNTLQAGIVKAVLEAIHRDHDFVAECKRQVQRQRDNRFAGWRDIWIQTLGGQYIHLKTPYVTLPKAIPQDSMDEKRYRHGTGIYTVLRRLGIVERATPRLLAEVNRQMADGPSGAETEQRFASREISLTEQPLWLHVKNFASIALWQRQADIHHLNRHLVVEPAPLAGKRVVVGLDGGRLRLRIYKKRPDETQTRRYSTDQCEPKLFAIYTIDEKGNKERKGEVLYDGTLQCTAELFTLLKLRLKQLGIQQADLLVIVGDGARWIWNGVPELRKDLELTHIRVIEIVDWGHAAGKLMSPAKVGLQQQQRQQKWFKRMRTFLKQGEINKIITALQELDQSNDTDEVIRTTIQYFQTHKTRMQYDKFRAEGLPIGSGVIESGVRRIVNLRLKGSSIFWLPEHAEEILYLRCQVKSGRWIPFVKSVLTQWADDISTSLTQAYQVRDDIATAVLAAHPPVYVSDERQKTITWARQIIDSREALILDTETTGLEANDEVIQVGIIDLNGNVLLNALVRPTVSIAPEARSVHGMTDQALADAPYFSDLYDAIATLLSNRFILAYNADFDNRLLGQTCAKYGLPVFEVTEWDCVMERYASFWGERSKSGQYKPQSLSTACAQQGVDTDGHHEAVKDCLLTLELIKAMAVADEEED